MKKIFALLISVCLFVTPVTAFAEETDYSYLEDMSVKELRALRDAINELLGNDEEDSDMESVVIEGVYLPVRLYFSDDRNYKIVFTPDNSEKRIGSFKETTVLGTTIGEYRISADLLSVKKKDEDVIYQIVGNYLIPHESDCTGFIPDEDTFDTEISYIYNTYIFKSDGTHEHQYYSTIGDLNNNKLTITSGSYKRNEDFLIIYEDNAISDAFLITDGKANRYAYIKE